MITVIEGRQHGAPRGATVPVCPLTGPSWLCDGSREDRVAEDLVLPVPELLSATCVVSTRLEADAAKARILAALRCLRGCGTTPRSSVEMRIRAARPGAHLPAVRPELPCRRGASCHVVDSGPGRTLHFRRMADPSARRGGLAAVPDYRGGG